LGEEGNQARADVTDGIAEGVGIELPEPKEPEGEGKQPAEGEGKPPAEGVKTPPAAAPEAPAERVPDTWKPEAKAEWAKVPPLVRAEIIKREGDVAKFVADTKTDVLISTEVKKVFAPFADTFRKYNIEPLAHMAGLLRGQHELFFGSPEKKVEILQGLARDAGVDLAKLVDPNAPASIAPQYVEALRARDQRFAQLEQAVTGVTAEFQRSRASELEKDVLAFAQTHPLFWDVADDMTALLNSKAATSLQEAYEIAELKNPATRAKRLEMERTKLAEAQAAKDAERAGRAKSASSANVRSRGHQRATGAEETLDETLKAGLAAIHARQTH
jgi:hypothetical protein